MANKVIEDLIKKAKSASVANRGAYPYTTAANVFKQDGTSVEEKTSNIEFPEADVIVNPESTPIVEVISSVEDGAVIAVTDGVIVEEIVLNKGVVIQGVNAGIPQNHKQEV